jgi:hypothetical protein
MAEIARLRKETILAVVKKPGEEEEKNKMLLNGLEMLGWMILGIDGDLQVSYTSTDVVACLCDRPSIAIMIARTDVEYSCC